MKSKNLGWIALAAIVIGAWYLTARSNAPAGPKPGAAQPPTVVNVVTPQRQDVPIVLQANGSVTPISSVDLHPQTTSTVFKVHIREGQYVKAGALMFSLDARSELAAIDKARAQVVRDQAALDDVLRQYQRSVELVARHFISQGAVDTLNSQLASARALLAADSAALRAVQVSASYSSIRAPLSGRVGAINIYPGSLVQPATSLTTITQLDPINVAFTLPENHLAALLAGQKAGTVPVGAALANSNSEVEGALSFIDNAVDPVAGVIRVKARFDNRDTRLWPGQYVNVRLTLNTLKDALVIPQNAIVNNTLGTFVYTMEADQSAKMRNVTRLYAFGLNAAVTGLTGTEQVIVEGKQNLRAGAKVRLAEVAAPSKQRASAGQGMPK